MVVAILIAVKNSIKSYHLVLAAGIRTSVIIVFVKLKLQNIVTLVVSLEKLMSFM